MIENKRINNIFISWLTIFSIIPFFLIFILAFFDGEGHLTLSNLKELLNPLYLKIILSSILNATIITLVSCIIIIPLTYLITIQKNKTTWLLIFLIPTWINLLLKVYAFIGILATDGVINSILEVFNLGPINFLFDIKGFLIVTIYVFMPFLMIPLFNSIIEIPNNIIKAAKDLGASDFNILFKIIIPNCKEAIASGITLIFIPSLSIFMISRLITGSKILTLGTVIEQQFMVTGDWNLGSASAIILIVLMLMFSVFIKYAKNWKVRSEYEKK